MKRFFLVLLTCMLIIVGSVSLADTTRDFRFEQEIAGRLKQLGIFKGFSDDDFGLSQETSRVEAIVLVIRLMGKEADAIYDEWEHPFTDVPSWAKNYVGYAYNNNITKGISDTEFGTQKIECNTFLTYLLRSIGYSDTKGKDFDWQDPYSLATKIQLLPSTVDRENFVRADTALITYAALNVRTKNTRHYLYDDLISSGAIDQKIFNEAYDRELLDSKEEYLKQHPLEEEVKQEPVSITFTRPNLVKDNWPKEQLQQYVNLLFSSCKDSVINVHAYLSNRYLSSGSGFFINAENYAITNYHVIKDSYKIKVNFVDNKTKEYDAYVVSYDEENDLAVLYVKDVKKYDFLELSYDVEQYDYCFTCGYPTYDGEQVYKVTSGWVIYPVFFSRGKDYIRTSNQTQHGNSGGPGFDGNRRVIGVVTFGNDTNIALVPSYKILNLLNNTDYASFTSSLARGKVKAINNFRTSSNKDAVPPKTNDQYEVVVPGFTSGGQSIPLYYNKGEMYYFEGVAAKIESVTNYKVEIKNHESGNLHVTFGGSFKITQMPYDNLGSVAGCIQVFQDDKSIFASYLGVNVDKKKVGDEIPFKADLNIAVTVSSWDSYSIKLGNDYYEDTF